MIWWVYLVSFFLNLEYDFKTLISQEEKWEAISKEMGCVWWRSFEVFQTERSQGEMKLVYFLSL